MNHMTVTKLWSFSDNEPIQVHSDEEDDEIKADVVTLRILRIGNIANNARLNRSSSHDDQKPATSRILSSTQGRPGTTMLRSRWVGQPTDVAMLDMMDKYREHDVREALGPRLGEIPFSSERKWMGVTIRDVPQDTSASSIKDIAHVKGAIDRILNMCDTYLTTDGREMVLDAPRRQQAMQAADKLAEDGLRVLAFASGVISKQRQTSGRVTTPISALETSKMTDDMYKGLTFAGIVGMSDPVRPGVAKSIRKLLRGGVKVIMITGDADTTALAIGKKLGMPIAHQREASLGSGAARPVLRGDELDAMSDQDLKVAIGQTTIFARTSPDHKLRIVRALQARGDVVAMTGDGVNDAPALKKADIGIAMGMMGTDVAKEAGDMILTDDDFSTILHAIEEGKGIFSNIQNFLTFQLSTSAAALSLVFLCTCFGLKTPLNAMQILWISKCTNYRILIYC